MRAKPLRLAFFCPPYSGHLHPMQALAAELCKRGHEVTFLAIDDALKSLRMRGFSGEAVGLQSHPAGTLGQLELHLTRLRGLLGIGAVIDDVAAMTDMLCRDAPALLKRLRPDGIVFDQLEPAGGLLSRYLGVPSVSVANALMIDREPYVPPPFTDWPYTRTAWARERNLGGYRVSDWLMSRVGAVIARWSASFGLQDRRRPDQCVASHQVGQLSPELDFPREDLPDGFHYSGPLRTPLEDEAPWEHPPAAQQHPLAFVSLGSLQGGRFELISRICRACHDLGLKPVVVHNGRLKASQVTALPGSPIVEDFLPQRNVIARCALVVTHGGMNTVLDGLSAGVPLALVPLAMEQGAIAQRVVRAGAGQRVRGPLASTGALRALIDDVLIRPDYRRQALRMADSLRACGGARGAAERIERHVLA